MIPPPSVVTAWTNHNRDVAIYGATAGGSVWCFLENLFAVVQHGAPPWTVVPPLFLSFAALVGSVNAYRKGFQERRHAEEIHQAALAKLKPEAETLARILRIADANPVDLAGIRADLSRYHVGTTTEPAQVLPFGPRPVNADPFPRFRQSAPSGAPERRIIQGDSQGYTVRDSAGKILETVTFPPRPEAFQPDRSHSFRNPEPGEGEAKPDRPDRPA